METNTKTATKKTRLTSAQKAAITAYEREERYLDNYLGSVFVTPIGQREREAKVKTAYNACLALGMGVEHGL